MDEKETKAPETDPVSAENPEEGQQPVQEEKQEEKKKGKKKFIIILIILLLLLLLLIGIVVYLLFGRNEEDNTVLEPDYASIDVEENAEAIGDDDDEKLEASEGGGAVALVYSDEVTVDLSAGTLTLYYQNPTRSTQNIVVQVIVTGSDDDEYLLAQSGILEPGYMVTTLDLEEELDVTLTSGVYSGIFRLLFYDPDTGERAVVDTEIPIDITVTDSSEE